MPSAATAPRRSGPLGPPRGRAEPLHSAGGRRKRGSGEPWRACAAPFRPGRHGSAALVARSRSDREHCAERPHPENAIARLIVALVGCASGAGLRVVLRERRLDVLVPRLAAPKMRMEQRFLRPRIGFGPKRFPPSLQRNTIGCDHPSASGPHTGTVVDEQVFQRWIRGEWRRRCCPTARCLGHRAFPSSASDALCLITPCTRLAPWRPFPTP